MFQFLLWKYLNEFERPHWWFKTDQTEKQKEKLILIYNGQRHFGQKVGKEIGSLTILSWNLGC